MMYTTFTVDGTDYKLRLGAKACVDLEKKLNTNPVNVLMEIAEKGRVPTVLTALTILQASMVQFNHNITMNEVYDIYDKYVAEGHTLLDLIPVIMEVFKVSGLIPEDAEEAGKN